MTQFSNTVQNIIGERDDTIRNDKFIYHKISDYSTVFTPIIYMYWRQLYSWHRISIILFIFIFIVVWLIQQSSSFLTV